MRGDRFASYFTAPYLVRFILIFVFYFVTAKLGLLLDPVGGFATLVWPASGISLAFLLLWGRKYWPAVAFAAFLVNFTQGAFWIVALGIALGNTLEAVSAVYLLRVVFRSRKTIESLRDVWGLLLCGAIICTQIAATIGSISLYLGGVISSAIFWPTWTAWWIGDMLGVAVVTPFILYWVNQWRGKVKIKSIIEAVILFGVLVFISMVILGGFFGIDTRGIPRTYLLYVPLLLISLRFGPREYATAMIVLSILAIVSTINGRGIFAREQVSEGLFYLQLFIAVTVGTFFPLSVLVQEKREFEKRKDEFLAIASHELKTPLTTIKAYAELLKRRLSKGEDRTKRYINTIDTQVRNLTKLINDMLDITKITSGKIELGLEEFEINEFIRKIFFDLQKATKSKRLIFDGKKKAQVVADPYKITQVVTNLITNALKYSEKEVTVKVKVFKTYVEISVKDSGVGIDKNHHKSLFKRFYQVDHAVGKKTGLGLGLYISYQIIRLHKGKMWVKSTPGRGSLFCFTLPRKE